MAGDTARTSVRTPDVAPHAASDPAPGRPHRPAEVLRFAPRRRQARARWGVLYAGLAAALIALGLAAWLPDSLRSLAELALIAAVCASVWCWLRANRRALADGKPFTNFRG